MSNVMVPLMLFGYLPLSLLFFTVLPVRRAIAATIVFGFAFLPVAGYNPVGLPSYDKITAVSIATLLGAVIFDSGSLFRLRPSWFDIPVLILCATPMASSLTNGLGAFDGVSNCLSAVFMWGIPYALGRAYFSDLSGAADLAKVIVLAGLIYVPICFFEIRFSPQLHKFIYGFYHFPFHMAHRLGGFRPVGFMLNGLQTALFMSIAAVVAFCLWRSKAMAWVVRIPMGVVFGILFVTAVWCRSVGAFALMVLALAVAFVSKSVRLSVLLGLFCLVPVGYVAVRGTGVLPTAPIVDAAKTVVGAERANSLFVRLRSEDTHIQKAMDRPMFGWGGWNRNRVDFEEGGHRSITDGYWVIIIGQRGLVGLAGFILLLCLPGVLFCVRFGRLTVTHPWLGAGMGLSLGIAMFAIDSMLNAQPSPIYTVAAGALMGLRPTPQILAALHDFEAAQAMAGRGRKGQAAVRRVGVPELARGAP